MHILSGGVPMTPGEVYALLRRRRDERSAAGQPPFCLQRAQANPQGRSSNAVVQRRSAAAGAPGARRPIATDGAPSAVDVAAVNALLGAADAGHLAVLLTEVRALHLLSLGSNGAATRVAALRDIYGPSTVYADASAAAAAAEAAPATVKVEGERKAPRRGGGGDDVKAATPEGEAERLLHGAVTRTSVGRRSHVRCVGAALAYYEAKGRQQEMEWAAGLRALLAAMVEKGHWPPQQQQQRSSEGRRSGAGDRGNEEEEVLVASSNASRRNSTHFRGGQPQSSGNSKNAAAPAASDFSPAIARGAADDSIRPLLAAPIDLVTMKPAVATTAAVQRCGAAAPLSQEELMRLVAERPRSRLQIHRLLDGLYERFADDEAAVEFFVSGVVRVFTGAQ